MVIDGDEGYFKETAWVKEPVEYPLINKEQAEKIVLQRYRNHGASLIKTELIWEPSEGFPTPYYPYWKIDVDGMIWYVTQDSKAQFIGDVSGNGSITDYDAGLIIQYIQGRRELVPCQKKAGDVNIDGRLTNADVWLILQYVARRRQKNQ